MPLTKPYSISRAELEAAAALRTIDEYQARFRRLRDAQLSWVQSHNTKVSRYCPFCDGECEFGPQTPMRPHRIPSEDLGAARAAVRSAVRKFLMRLFHAGFISESDVRREAELVGEPIEAEDFEMGR